MKKLTVPLGMTILITASFMVSGCYGTFTYNEANGFVKDKRDGKEYEIIKLAGLWWMAENLDYNTDDDRSWYYNDAQSTLGNYGRLYAWEGAYGACPAGWRLPTKQDWARLIDEIGEPETAYSALILNGDTGFDALLGGFRDKDKLFKYIGSGGAYWTTTDDEGRIAWTYAFLGNSQIVAAIVEDKSIGVSCRCVKAP